MSLTMAQLIQALYAEWQEQQPEHANDHYQAFHAGFWAALQWSQDLED